MTHFVFAQIVIVVFWLLFRRLAWWRIASILEVHPKYGGERVRPEPRSTETALIVLNILGGSLALATGTLRPMSLWAAASAAATVCLFIAYIILMIRVYLSAPIEAPDIT